MRMDGEKSADNGTADNSTDKEAAADGIEKSLINAVDPFVNLQY